MDQDALDAPNTAKNGVKLLPEHQRSEIPDGWRATPNEPIPVVRCTVIKQNGERCLRWSMRGLTKCYAHAKRELRFPSVQAHRDAVIEAARLRLLDMSDEAVETLRMLQEPGTAEGIRLKAATEVLDRAGIRGGFEIDMEVGEKVDTTKIIQDRLEKLREAAGIDVIEGEVVEDDTTQMTLFDDDGS